jgi:hypothetical protein
MFLKKRLREVFPLVYRTKTSNSQCKKRNAGILHCVQNDDFSCLDSNGKLLSRRKSLSAEHDAYGMELREQ